MKEYNVKRHYTTRHSSQFDEILGQARVDKIEHLKKTARYFYQLQESFRTGYNTDFYSYVSLWLKKRKPFGDGEFIKNCLTILTEYACPENKQLVEQTSLSRLTVSRKPMIFLIILKKL